MPLGVLNTSWQAIEPPTRGTSETLDINVLGTHILDMHSDNVVKLILQNTALQILLVNQWIVIVFIEGRVYYGGVLLLPSDKCFSTKIPFSCLMSGILQTTSFNCQHYRYLPFVKYEVIYTQSMKTDESDKTEDVNGVHVRT